MPTWTNRYKHLETLVGAGYYALRANTSKAGRLYTKLVKADRSPSNHIDRSMITTPSIGHNARRQHILDRRGAANA